MIEPKVMDVVNPNDSDITQNDPVCESCALTVLLGSNNAMWYYEGMQEHAAYKTTTYQPSGIRQLINKKRKEVLNKSGKDRFVLIIKPLEHSDLRNLVDIIDESKINLVKRYYIDEPTAAEQGLYK